MAKKITSYKGLNSVALCARAIGMDPKVARAKVRRHGKEAPVQKTKDLTEAQAKKLVPWLQTDLRNAAE